MRAELAQAPPQAEADTQSSRKGASVSTSRLAHRLLPAALGFVLGSRYLRDADVFWHLMLGRAVLQHGSRTVPEPTASFVWSAPCLVKDWLWDVGCYALYRAGGFGLVGLLPAVFGALIAYRTARLVELSRDAAPRLSQTCLVVLAVCAGSEIFDARPNLVLLTMIPWCIELSLRYLRSESPRSRFRLAAALVVLELLWAQLHSSFVLGAALFVCVAFEHVVRAPSVGRERRAELGALLLCMLLAMTTSAAGFSVAQLVWSHAAGDAARHIQDMQAFDWTEFSLHWQTPLAIVALWSLGWAGVIAAGLRAVFGATLLALGLALTLNSARFVYIFALLSLPWASAGLYELERALPARAFRRLQLAVAGVSALALVLGFARIHDPLFRYGLGPGQQPEAAARYLEQLPRGGAVFTEYTLGAPLGFWLEGRLNTFVDARTLNVFDDTDYAIARDMLTQGQALDRGFARYGFVAAVVERESSVCTLLEARWIPVVIEPRHTTFVPPGRGQAVAGLLPCGRRYLRTDACDVPAAAWHASLARLSQLGVGELSRLLAAGMQLQCGRGAPELARLPPPRAAYAYMPTYRLYRAWALFAAGRPDEALSVIDDALDDHDALAALSLREPQAGIASVAGTRRVLARALELMDDNAPAPLRARMAWLCKASEDVECARFHGLRAFVAGDPSVRPVLKWVAQHHPRPHVRADLAAWLASQAD